jgi:hypothetical protein
MEQANPIAGASHPYVSTHLIAQAINAFHVKHCQESAG